MEEELYSLFSAAPFLTSFAAGVLSFLAPCVLPLVPSYVSYISGLSIGRLTNETEKLSAKEHIKLVGTAFLFVLGFSTIFIAIGVLGDLLVGNDQIGRWIDRPQTRIGAGAIIVFFGLYFMRLIPIKYIYSIQKRVNFTTKIAFLSPYALGASFAVGWTPCTGPVLGAIATMSVGGERGDAIVLMSLFSLGLGTPFLLIAFLTSWAFNMLNRIKPYFRWIEIIGGVLLVAIGVSYIYDGIYRLIAI